METWKNQGAGYLAGRDGVTERITNKLFMCLLFFIIYFLFYGVSCDMRIKGQHIFT